MKKLYSIFGLIIGLGFAEHANAQCNVTFTYTSNGLTINVSATATGVTQGIYGWSWGDTQSTTNQQTSTHTFATPGTYQVCAIVADLLTSCTDSSCQMITVTATGINTASAISQSFNCLPNPVNNATQVNYALASAANVNIRAYDVLGNEVAVLENGTVQGGQHTINWNTENLSKGVYFVRLQAGDITSTIKVVKQ